MKIIRTIGTVTATVKDVSLTSRSLMVVDVLNGALQPTGEQLVAVDNCGAGVGELCLMVTGASARVADGLAIAPVDAVLVAIIDELTVAKQASGSATTKKE